jgi:hypothetical protein
MEMFSIKNMEVTMLTYQVGLLLRKTWIKKRGCENIKTEYRNFSQREYRILKRTGIKYGLEKKSANLFHSKEELPQ